MSSSHKKTLWVASFIVLVGLLILFLVLDNKKQAANLSPEDQDIQAELDQLEKEASDLEESIK